MFTWSLMENFFKKQQKNLNKDSPKLSALMFSPFPHLLLSPPHPPHLDMRHSVTSGLTLRDFSTH